MATSPGTRLRRGWAAHSRTRRRFPRYDRVEPARGVDVVAAQVLLLRALSRPEHDVDAPPIDNLFLTVFESDHRAANDPFEQPFDPDAGPAPDPNAQVRPQTTCGASQSAVSSGITSDVRDNIGGGWRASLSNSCSKRFPSIGSPAS